MKNVRVSKFFIFLHAEQGISSQGPGTMKIKNLWKNEIKTGHATMAILLAGGEQIKTLRNAQKG